MLDADALELLPVENPLVCSGSFERGYSLTARSFTLRRRWSLSAEETLVASAWGTDRNGE